MVYERSMNAGYLFSIVALHPVFQGDTAGGVFIFYLSWRIVP